MRFFLPEEVSSQEHHETPNGPGDDERRGTIRVHDKPLTPTEAEPEYDRDLATGDVRVRCKSCGEKTDLPGGGVALKVKKEDSCGNCNKVFVYRTW